jgi:hypothetical protein
MDEWGSQRGGYSALSPSPNFTQFVIGAAISQVNHHIIINYWFIIIMAWFHFRAPQHTPRRHGQLKNKKLRLINIQLIHTSYYYLLLAANHIIRHNIHLLNKSEQTNNYKHSQDIGMLL